MAAVDAAWNQIAGKGHPSDNAVVARLLHKSPDVAPLRVAIERHGYEFSGLSVEKVWVTSVNGLRLPYDAILWLVVEQKNSVIQPCVPSDGPYPAASGSA